MRQEVKKRRERLKGEEGRNEREMEKGKETEAEKENLGEQSIEEKSKKRHGKNKRSCEGHTWVVWGGEVGKTLNQSSG